MNNYLKFNLSKEHDNPENEDFDESSEDQMITLINITILNKITEAVKNREISIDRAQLLIKWWGEFMETFKFPLEIRAERMREVINKGKIFFENEKIFKTIIDAFKDKEDVCDSCGGTGWKTCSRCGGAGQLYGSTPPGYIGMPIRSVCDSCYGRGGNQCYICGGSGHV